jgi:hypothetical protein
LVPLASWVQAVGSCSIKGYRQLDNIIRDSGSWIPSSGDTGMQLGTILRGILMDTIIRGTGIWIQSSGVYWWILSSGVQAVGYHHQGRTGSWIPSGVQLDTLRGTIGY